MPSKQRVVVVEDEDAIRRGIVDALGVAGYDVVEAADGVTGLKHARQAGVDLVLLDLLMPVMNGFDVLKELRTTHPSLPVIILTARGSEDDRVYGLRHGADDYVIKPFSARELLARVEAVLRRSPERPTPVLKMVGGDKEVDCGRREICEPDGSRTALSEMETSILDRLASHAGRAVSREELLSCVWGIRDGQIETRAIDMHITRLRQKLHGDREGNGIDWIVTVRGKGYMLGPEIQIIKDSQAEGNT